jgi:hypothetical protein
MNTKKQTIAISYTRRMLNIILNSKSKKRELEAEFNTTVNSIIKALADNNSGTLVDLTEEFLIINLISLITTPSKTFESTYSMYGLDNEKEFIDLLKKQKAILRKAAISPMIVSDDKNKQTLRYREKSHYIIEEMDYLLLWLYRRDANFSKAIEIGIDKTERYPDDCRFAHGLGLAYHALAYSILRRENGDNISEVRDEVVDKLDMSYSCLMKALKCYSAMQEENNYEDDTSVQLINKSIIAIYNTLADANIRKYILGMLKERFLLDEAQLHVNKMKDYYLLINDKYENDPTVNHTEAEMNYLYAKHYYDQKEYQIALPKILRATSSIHYFEKCNEQVDDVFQSIIQDIAEMRYKLIEKNRCL